MATVFAIAFVAELCAAGYTLALARNHFRAAVLFSGLVGLINWGIAIMIIDNHTLLLPSVAGEMLGTAVAMRASMLRK